MSDVQGQVTGSANASVGASSKKATKISNRFAYKVVEGKRVSVTDYTEATIARYEYVGRENINQDTGAMKEGFVPTAVAEHDFSAIQHDGERACAIDGYLNKAGHQVNKVVNATYKGVNVPYDEVAQALKDYQELINEGGWTSGLGEGFAGLSLIFEAIARSPAAQQKGYTVEQIKAAWPKMAEERQAAIRQDPQVKRIVAEIRLERQRAQEQAATQPSALDTFDLGA